MERYRLELARDKLAVLRELSGDDEESVGGTDTDAAIRLLDRLLVDAPGAVAPRSAARLTSAERDRLMAALYRRTWGDRVETTVTCRSCRQHFDVDFALGQLLASLEPDPGRAVPEGDGWYRLDGRRFRIPTGEDELRCAGEAQLLACCVEGDGDPAEILEAMRALAPIVDLELDARCPECEATQSVHFDLQAFVLGTLRAERGRRALEIHRLATAYGWTLSEIMALARSQRQRFVTLIDREGLAR